MKTVLKCNGKYLQCSVADFTWLEAVIFGPEVIENSILNGGHYSHCLDALQLLDEAINRLLYIEFFNEKGIKAYKKEFAVLLNLKSPVKKKKYS